MDNVDPTSLSIIRRVARYLAPRFVFGHYDVEDIEQEGVIEGIKALPRYDSSRGASLETFMHTHIYRRLYNLKRNKYHRPNTEDVAKKNIIDTINLDVVNHDGESRMSLADSHVTDIEEAEAIEAINRELPVSLRADYIKIKHGVYVPKDRKTEVIAEVLNILRSKGWEITNEEVLGLE